MSTGISGFNVAVAGVQAAEKQLVKAVEDIGSSLLAAAVAENRPADESVVADSNQGAVVPTVDEAGGDLLKPIVDFIQAKVAYQASLLAVKITADVERDTTRLLKRLV